MNSETRMVPGMQGVRSEIFIELSPYTRATVHALQNRKEGAGPINWGVLAKDLNITIEQLKIHPKIRRSIFRLGPTKFR
jgi:hypothetical protein